MKEQSVFQQLLDDDWEFRMKADPLLATSTGDNRYNDRLPEISEQYYQTFRMNLLGFLERLEKIDSASLTPAERLDYEIYSRLLVDEIGLLGFHAFRMPVSKAGGFHTYFPELYKQMPLVTEYDFQNYIARISSFKEYVNGCIGIMRRGLLEGQVASCVTMEGVPESVHSHMIIKPADSIFYKPLLEQAGALPDQATERLQKECKEAIQESIIPGFTAFYEFLTREYIPACRKSIAATDLPGGQDFYSLCIRHYTSLDLAADEIHQVGLGEVNRIQAEMVELIRKIGFAGDLKAFIEYLRTDNKFYPSTPQELLEKTALVLKRMDGELPGLFNTLPRLPYGIRAIPGYAAPGSTTAYYQPGAGDGSRAGYYYVNTYDLKSRPLYEIEALSLHEAVPGHHLQISLQQELDLPNFRRFNGFTCFVEGWALYAERLGLETGFYNDPYSDFGRLSYEMWRACRLVVDTGMHALGWTRQQAINFMADHTSLTQLNIANEIDRYIAWPGQALAYKIGEIKIRQLRVDAEKSLGVKFDKREFHHQVLKNGAVPLDLLETMIREWLGEQG